MNHYDKLLSFVWLPGLDRQEDLLAIACDSLNDLTLVPDARPFKTGTYAPEMIQELRHLCQGAILIADEGGDEELKLWMLRLFGLYAGKGYYKVSYFILMPPRMESGRHGHRQCMDVIRLQFPDIQQEQYLSAECD